MEAVRILKTSVLWQPSYSWANGKSFHLIYRSPKNKMAATRLQSRWHWRNLLICPIVSVDVDNVADTVRLFYESSLGWHINRVIWYSIMQLKFTFSTLRILFRSWILVDSCLVPTWKGVIDCFSQVSWVASVIYVVDMWVRIEITFLFSQVCETPLNI
jgi:hypothetical protein